MLKTSFFDATQPGLTPPNPPKGGEVNFCILCRGLRIDHTVVVINPPPPPNLGGNVVFHNYLKDVLMIISM
nr:MAG TPA: hypothetical protein [Microviridae sp.]